MKCPNCGGKGYKEYESGLIQVPCKECEATGEVPGWKLDQILKREGKTNDNPTEVDYIEKVKSVAHASNNFLEIERRVISPNRVKDDNTTDRRAGPDDKPTRSPDTGKPSKPKKRRAKKKTAKKSR